jgi:glycosyltransferase involved in cell wall biosynthesis
MSARLTVVMPVHNEARSLTGIVHALAEAVAVSGFETDLIVVDDGSTDGSGEVARAAANRRIVTTVVEQPQRGRFAARRAGLETATGEWVLLLDGRVRLDPEALAHVAPRVAAGDRVWAGHVDVDADGNLYGAFWKLIAELAWPDYFADPRDMSFGSEDFDRYPKGTGCLLAPRALLLEAFGSFRSFYDDVRDANDDTPLLRWIAERERIHLSPRYRCSYRPRTTLTAFVRHSMHRGVVFLDGHGRPESRFFPLAVVFFPVSLGLALWSVRRPSVALAAGAAVSAGASALGVAHRRSRHEIASLALLAPVYAVAHGLGMWKGLAKIALGRHRPE